MNRKTKGWIFAAAALIIIGGISFGGGMKMLGWDFTKLSTTQYETNEYAVAQAYTSIVITVKAADIELVPSENAQTRIVCREPRNARHKVEVREGALMVEVVDERKWYEHIGINFGSPRITIYIPQGEYDSFSVQTDTGNVKIPACFGFKSMDVSADTGDVTNAASVAGNMKIRTDTGSIQIKDVSAGMMDLSVLTGGVAVESVVCQGDVKVHVSTGKARFSKVRCLNLFSDGSTGDILLTDTIATQTMSVERSTGEVKLDGCDAAEIYIRTATGSVRGTLLTDKIFIAKTDAGTVHVPASVSGGRCEVRTSTGDIRLDVR